MLEFINEELNELRQAGLYRDLKKIDRTDGRLVEIGGKKLLNFCSNNYLGLANHPKVIAAAKKALDKFGTGAGASRLISGNLELHERLEAKIAEFKSRPAALLFPTGFMANLGTISTLMDENDTVIIDRLNHASIIDACRLSKAKLQVYPHNDMAVLEKILQRSDNFKKRLIITDSVFSMDGDLAPLPQIVKLAKNYKAITMIDEAHATGVLGSGGRGLEDHFKLVGSVDIVMGTLSKAVGSLGGFVAGSSELIEYLRNKARSFIYTTALPPAACGAALAALELIETTPGIQARLWDNIRYFRPKAESAIIPIMIGEADNALKISAQLLENGILLSAIRPPTVPFGESRLRLTLTALHTREDIECLASLLRELIPAAVKLT
jgi:8-amino-7-oxononanoate synthase